MWEMVLGAAIMLVGIIFGAVLTNAAHDNGRTRKDEL